MPTDALDDVLAQWADQMPSLGTDPLHVFGRLQRLVARSDTLLRAPFADAGLADGDFDLLAALRRTPPPHALSPGRLGEAMLVSSGAVTKRIDRLERAGLVTRTRGARDGRERVVALTERGAELAGRLMRQHMDNEADLLSPLEASEREVLGDLLRRLLIGVEERGAAQDRRRTPSPSTASDPAGR